MRIIVLSQETHSIDIFTITEEYEKWYAEHNASEDESYKDEMLDRFVAEFLDGIGYNKEFVGFKPQYIIAEDYEGILLRNMYPQQDLIKII